MMISETRDQTLEELKRYFKAQEVRHAQRMGEWKAWADEWDRTSDARVVFAHNQELINAITSRPTKPRLIETEVEP